MFIQHYIFFTSNDKHCTQKKTIKNYKVTASFLIFVTILLFAQINMYNHKIYLQFPNITLSGYTLLYNTNTAYFGGTSHMCKIST